MDEQRGYVAFLDVLGFRELIAREKPLEELERYVRTVIQVTDAPPERKTVQYVLFSDSIIMNTEEQTDDALQTLLSVTGRLFALLLQKQIAVRGAVAGGQFVRYANNARGVIIAGRPIVDAIEFERKQKWVGIALTPDTVRLLPQLDALTTIAREDAVLPPGEVSAKLPWPRLLARCDRIPYAADGLEGELSGYAVLPCNGDAKQVAADLGRAIEALGRMRQYAPDPRSQAKYSATIRWLREVEEPWKSKLAGASWARHLSDSGRG